MGAHRRAPARYDPASDRRLQFDDLHLVHGDVHQPSPTSPIPGGVTVDLISSATGQTYATTTTSGGQFVFSSAGNAPTLAPGTWGVWVPTQTNASLPGCGPYGCAILPPSTAPQYLYQSSGNLTAGGADFVTIGDVNVLQDNATLNGTVTYQGSGARGAIVELLDPVYNNVILVSNGTNARGAYTMEAPAGPWVLKTIYPGPTVRYNVSQITIPAFGTVHRNVAIQDYLIQGYLSSTNGAITTSGNVTVYDPTNGYIYSSPTPPGGFYSFGSYANLTTGGPQTFDVFLSATNYSTVSYTTTVSSGNTVTKNVVTTPAATSQKENYATTLNFAGINSTLGTGSLSVYTNATLGNDSLFPSLANASIGQLWAQLGLDFSHGLTLVDTSVPAVLSWINSTGAFFPAIQTGTSINGTTFTTSYGSGGQPLYTFQSSTPCSTTGLWPELDRLLDAQLQRQVHAVGFDRREEPDVLDLVLRTAPELVWDIRLQGDPPRRFHPAGRDGGPRGHHAHGHGTRGNVELVFDQLAPLQLVVHDRDPADSEGR